MSKLARVPVPSAAEPPSVATTANSIGYVQSVGDQVPLLPNEPVSNSELAWLGLTLSIVGFVGAGAIPLSGFVFGGAGLVAAGIALRQARNGRFKKGLPIVGVVAGILALLAALVGFLAWTFIGLL